jgi:outer membrane protein TolC
VIQQVRQAFWEMAGAQAMEQRLEGVIADARAALEDSRKVQAERLVSPMETLTYQRQLLDIIRQLESVRDELSQARPRLASLMNLEPGVPFEVVVPSERQAQKLVMTVEQVETAALLNRPELVEAKYNERIGVLETRKAVARLLPGIEFSVGVHRDSNDFLVNRSWRDAGLRVSWNLLNMLNASTIKGAAQAQEELSRYQHMALSMAVLTQSHVAYRNYRGRLGQHELAQELGQIEQQILEQTRHRTRANAQGRLEEVRAAASAVVAELRDHHSYAALQGAYGQLLATIGWDPLPQEVGSQDLAGLRQGFVETNAKWAHVMQGGS